VAHCLGNLEPFVPEGLTLGKRTQIGMAPGEEGTREHRGQDGKPEAPVAPRPVETPYGLLEAVNRPVIVTLGMIDSAEIEVRQRGEDDIPASRDIPQDAQRSGNGLTIRATVVEIR
jgi:hypothetical protein